MASGPITSWQIDGERVETVRDFILGAFKITTSGDCSHEIKQSRTRLSNYTSTTSADFYVLGFCRLKEGLLATRALQSRIKAAEMLLHAYTPCLPAGALVSVELCLPTILHHPQFLPGVCPWTEEPGGLQSMGLHNCTHLTR